MLRLAALFWAVVAMLLLVVTAPVHAGYAQLAPPPGFTSVGGVSTMPVGAAANGARYAGGHVMANASLNLGARTVTVPVALRVAANAATFTATRLNPWIAGASLAVSAIGFAVDWFNRSDADLEVTPDGKIQVPGVPGTMVPPGVGDQLVFSGGEVMTLSQAASSTCPSGLKYSGSCGLGAGQGFGTMGHCAPYGAPSTPCYGNAAPPPQPVEVGGTPARPATEADLTPLGFFPVNPELLAALGLSLPVDPVPVINPATEPVGDVLVGPDVNPAPQLQPHPDPLRYPDGDPIPNPGTNPQTWTQPWLEVHPSPAPGNPWRIDVRPVTTIVTSPAPQPDPTPSEPNPPAVPPDFYTDCEKFPSSLGCMPVGDAPAPDVVPRESRTLELQNGPSFSGSGCPANLTFSLRGHQYTGIDMAGPCSWISGLVKPVVLLLAFISAVGIVRSALKG